MTAKFKVIIHRIGYNLLMGRRKTLPVFADATRADRIWPSDPVSTATIRPTFHWCRGTLSSWISTLSSIFGLIVTANIDDVIPECYTFLFSPSDWISFGNGTSFPRDSFVHQRGTPVKIFPKMRILAPSFQWGVSQVLRGLRFWDNCVQSFQFYFNT